MGRHQKPLKLLLILRLFFALYCYDAVSGSDLDKSALLEFKNSVSDPSGVLASWTGSNSDHCSWVGVTCGSNSRVVALNITGGGNSGSFSCTKYDRFLLYGFGIRKNCVGHNAKLRGKLSYAISKLSELRVLSLPFTDLSGEIPVEIWGMKKLEVIDLEGNMIHGHLQSNFTGLRRLRVLNLGFNRVSGEIPDSFSNFKNLQVLNLATNHVNGSIPMFLNEFRDLKGLYLSFNQLSGEIPSEIGYSCGNLEYLELAGNFLLGRIPASLSNCTKLRSVLLYSNMLQEEIPVALGQLGMLQVLDVSRNSLSGAIPRELGNCSQLRFLDLSSNKLAGELSDELPVPCMTIFDVSNNYLSGPIPSFRYTNCEPFNPSSAYLQYFSLHTPLPFGNDGGYLAIMHNFGGNNFTGALSSLPIASERTRVNSVYAFLAGENELSGRFPGVLFDRCSDLKAMVVNISSNRFSGKIPSNIGQICRSLTVLDVSGNSLSGEIPEDLVNLRNLTVLLLNDNKLSGPIPSGFTNMTTITKFNVSSNNLSGPVLENLMATPSSEQEPPEPGRTSGGDYVNYSVSSTPTPKHGSRNFNSIEIAAITSASAIFSVLLALVVLFVCTRWRPKSVVHGLTRKEVTTFIDIGVPLTFENVVQSTGSFNASNCIGNGGFGATYKAEIAPGFLVAVKRLAVGRFQGVQQFDAEIKTLGRLRHPNLVTLIGYHASETEMFLVYNYLPRGNLEQFIQERPTRAVDWRVLHKIALDVARALAYLHDQCVPRVLHRDVKPSNILLDDDFNAYLSDFGLARLLGTSETHATTGVAGTFGYVAPEYAMTCRVSDKADVYSYGVVLLELMSDKKALDPSFSSYGNGFNIVAWACMLLREGQAKEFFATGLWDAGPHDDLVEVLHLAVVCTMDSLSTRPMMRQVVRRLKQLQPSSC